MVEQTNRSGPDEHTAPRRRRPWLIAAGFLLALAATVATVLLTGLSVRAPGGDDPAAFGAEWRRPAAGGVERSPAPPAR